MTTTFVDATVATTQRRKVRGLQTRLRNLELKRAELRAELAATELGELATATVHAKQHARDLRLARVADRHPAEQRRLNKQLQDLQALPFGALVT